MAKVSNYKFQIRGTLVVWGSTVSISNDLETNTEVSFTNEACLLYNDDKTVIERIRWSATGGTLTLSKRGMVNTSETESSWLEKERREGAFGALTIFAPQVVDALWANTFTAINTFEEAPVLEKGVASVIFANATARNAALWWNWSATQAYTGVQTWWVQQYYNLTTGQWEDVDTGTVTPNASTTVAGKVGIPTNTQVAAETDTSDTGAKNAVLPSQLSPAILTEKATFVWADKVRIADSEDSDSAKYIDASLIKTVVPNATETASWLMPERATDAEIITVTADKFSDTKQNAEKYFYTPWAWTDYTVASSNAEVTTTSTGYGKFKEIEVDRSGTYTVSYENRESANDADAWRLVYVNWSAYSWVNPWATTTYWVKTENITISAWDLVQLYMKAASWDTAYAKNFSVNHNIVDNRIAQIAWYFTWTVNT